MTTILCYASGCSLMAPKSSNAIEELGESVLKRKEGLEIILEPLEEIKGQNHERKDH